MYISILLFIDHVQAVELLTSRSRTMDYSRAQLEDKYLTLENRMKELEFKIKQGIVSTNSTDSDHVSDAMYTSLQQELTKERKLRIETERKLSELKASLLQRDMVGLRQQSDLVAMLRAHSLFELASACAVAAPTLPWGKVKEIVHQWPSVRAANQTQTNPGSEHQNQGGQGHVNGPENSNSSSTVTGGPTANLKKEKLTKSSISTTITD